MKTTKTQKTKKEPDGNKRARKQLVTWLERHDEYDLLWDGKTSPLPQLRRAKTLVQELDRILKRAAKDITKLKRMKMGLGDTATDAAVSNVLYSLIH